MPLDVARYELRGVFNSLETLLFNSIYGLAASSPPNEPTAVTMADPEVQPQTSVDCGLTRVITVEYCAWTFGYFCTEKDRTVY